MNALKRGIRQAVQHAGYELYRQPADSYGDVPRRLTYAEAQCCKALANRGQLSINEGRLLGDLVRSTDTTRPIIEIGTLFGFSTIVISLFKQRQQPLITVDNYCWNPLGISPDVHYEITKNRLAEVVANHNARLLRMDKNDFYRTYDGPPPALFFCDADHSYEATKRDITWAQSVGASIICGDDYDLASEPGVKRAVDELGGPRQLADGLFVL